MKVVGIIPGSELTAKYREIYHTCKELGVPIPAKVQEYIEKHGSVSDCTAREVAINNVREWDNVTEKGIDIPIQPNLLPMGVTHIRIYKSKYW